MYVGNFNVKIEHKPRYLDVAKCTGCAKCSEVCPVEVPYDFNEGLEHEKQYMSHSRRLYLFAP